MGLLTNVVGQVLGFGLGQADKAIDRNIADGNFAKAAESFNTSLADLDASMTQRAAQAGMPMTGISFQPVTKEILSNPNLAAAYQSYFQQALADRLDELGIPTDVKKDLLTKTFDRSSQTGDKVDPRIIDAQNLTELSSGAAATGEGVAANKLATTIAEEERGLADSIKLAREKHGLAVRLKQTAGAGSDGSGKPFSVQQLNSVKGAYESHFFLPTVANVPPQEVVPGAWSTFEDWVNNNAEAAKSGANAGKVKIAVKQAEVIYKRTNSIEEANASLAASLSKISNNAPSVPVDETPNGAPQPSAPAEETQAQTTQLTEEDVNFITTLNTQLDSAVEAGGTEGGSKLASIFQEINNLSESVSPNDPMWDQIQQAKKAYQAAKNRYQAQQEKIKRDREKGRRLTGK